MSILIKGMEMPKNCGECIFHRPLYHTSYCIILNKNCAPHTTIKDFCPLVPVPPHGRLRKRIVYRGEVYNAIEAARVNALDGILSDRYKNGFHDGLKRALEILANEVQDAPTIIEEEK